MPVGGVSSPPGEFIFRVSPTLPPQNKYHVELARFDAICHWANAWLPAPTSYSPGSVPETRVPEVGSYAG